MPRYVTRSDSWYMDEHRPMSLGAITVHAEDRSPEPTGLLDSHGNELYRMPDAIPFGFVASPAKPKRRKGKKGA